MQTGRLTVTDLTTAASITRAMAVTAREATGGAARSIPRVTRSNKRSMIHIPVITFRAPRIQTLSTVLIRLTVILIAVLFLFLFCLAITLMALSLATWDWFT